ncbi:MAG: hypothetical protein JHC98_00925 [Thermoleophilaceae bacterium]|nr:hypothetical protein [Thermoleophilaceae bacterium]
MTVFLTALIAGGTADAAKKTPKPKPNPFAATCNPAAQSAAIPGFHSEDAWRETKAYKFPFYGWTPAGLNTITWKYITGSSVRKARYPTPNLPSCRIGRFGTEDRTSRKSSRFFESLEPIDGSTSYELKDTYDRPVATIVWTEDPPVKYHPSKWGWFINGKWAGHDATRAFEVQGNACKLVATTTTTVVDGVPVTTRQWVRDPNYIMIAFNPSLGSPGKGYAPRHTSSLRVRAFVDRRAVPIAMLNAANKYDFGCGSTTVPARLEKQTLKQFMFESGFGPNRAYMKGYYFGEGANTLAVLPGEARLYNNMPYSNYNPRPQFNHATYAMINSTAVAGGGMVRGIVRSTVDRFTLFDEMRYCDPNYTLRNVQITRFKKHYKKSLYYAPESYSSRNRPAVRWVYGRLDPNPSTLTAEQALATQNPASVKLFAWMPIYCDR